VELLGDEEELSESLVSSWRGSKEMKPYDEVRDDEGRIRPVYEDVVQVVEKIQKKEPKRIDEFPVESQKGFSGDNRLYHVPRMLSEDDTLCLVRGVAQRAAALRCLILELQKHKQPKFSSLDCVKSGAVPETVLKRIAARAGRTFGFGGEKTRPGSLYWSMWYGPDIIRGPGPDGEYRWYVLEDNLGYVGGFGDLNLARRVLLGKKEHTPGFPELESTLGEDQTNEFYDELATHYARQVGNGERVVILYYPRSVRDDNEDRRVVQIFTKRGAAAVELPGTGGPVLGKPRLEVKGGRVYLITPPKDEKKEKKDAPKKDASKDAKDAKETKENKDTSKHYTGTKDESPKKNVKERSRSPARKKEYKTEKVGLVILLSEPIDIDPGHEAVQLRAAIQEARNRASNYDLEMKALTLQAKHAEKSLISVNNKVSFTDVEGNKHWLHMVGGKVDKDTQKLVGGKLIWTVQDKPEKKAKDAERVEGPLIWNESTSKLSEKEQWKGWACKPDAAGLKELQKNWVLSDMPVSAEKVKAKAEELRSVAEAASLLVRGRVNGSARRELFRLLRQDDKEEWDRLFNGKQCIPGLFEAYYAGKVKIANGPGFEMIEDKELCAHVDKLVRHFLNEEPILSTLPTHSFGSDPGLVRSVFDVPDMQCDFVIKRVDGRGGDAVWVGAKISREDFLSARPLVEAEPESFIVQKYTPLSQVDGHLVDLRAPALITSCAEELSGRLGAGVSPVLWGRGVPAEGGNGKVNISDRGFEFAIATTPSKPTLMSTD
jgi:uncharacterized circularly permuted ATP-grasp superfamily protein